MIERNCIILHDDVAGRLETLQAELAPARTVSYLRDDFLIDDAKTVTDEAYVSEMSTKYLILAAKQFNVYSQNSLLKLLEEPPKNIVFIVIAPSKAVLLPTVRSRLPLINELKARHLEGIQLTLRTLELDALFDFATSLSRLQRHDAKALIESIFYQATVIEGLILNDDQLSAFDRAYRLVEVNARLQNVIVMLLIQFIPEQRRAS